MLISVSDRNFHLIGNNESVNVILKLQEILFPAPLVVPAM
jgi:hypothetical protein